MRPESRLEDHRINEIRLNEKALTAGQIARLMHGTRWRCFPFRDVVLGDYRILSVLGEGAAGPVFKARRISVDHPVALRVLAPRWHKRQFVRERLLREVGASAWLQHPNIVAGIDVGRLWGLNYFAMEYVEGQSLQCMLEDRGGKLPEREALAIALQIATALLHAHAHGILHLDVKPSNVLIDGDGVAKLADLGLARYAVVADLPWFGEEPSASDGAIAHPDRVVGTPEYMSPEQARGEPHLRPAADFYSLGAMLFRMLTARPPFHGPTPRSVMRRHVQAEAPDPRQFEPAISDDAARICLRLLRKAPKERYPGGEALASELRQVHERCAPEVPDSAPDSVAQHAATPDMRREGNTIDRPLNRQVAGSRSSLNRALSAMAAAWPAIPLILAWLVLFLGVVSEDRRPDESSPSNARPGGMAVGESVDTPAGNGAFGNGRVRAIDAGRDPLHARGRKLE